MNALAGLQRCARLYKPYLISNVICTNEIDVVVFCVYPPTNSLGHMETGPQLKVSFDRLVKLEIEPVTPGLQGNWLIHYTTAAPTNEIELNETVHFFLLLHVCRLNPYKPSILFVGHRQTVETQIRRHITWHLIRVSTVCLQNVLLKFE